MHTSLSKYSRIIVKVGSALLTANGKRVDAAYVRRLAAQIAAVKTAERQVVVVSSGAIAAGMSRLGWTNIARRFTSGRRRRANAPDEYL